MDTSSINSHPSLVTTRLAHVGRPPGQARSGSETTARIQGIPQEPPAVAKTVRAPATLKAAAPRQIAGKGEGQGGQSMLEQLKADWGKAESPWDLNADGTVDIRDVLRLLAKIGGGARDAVEVPEQVIPNVNPVPQDVAEPGEEGNDGKTPIQQLLADWGKADSEWDLNGDGTVNIRDFLQLLAKIGGGVYDGRTPPSGPAPNAEAMAIDDSKIDEAPESKSRIEQLLADWGSSDSRWDVNGDGTVNIRDFLQMLSKMDKASRAEDAPQEPAPRVGHMARRAQAAYSPTTAQDLAMIRRGLSLNAVG
jgi:hypothetical protein